MKAAFSSTIYGARMMASALWAYWDPVVLRIIIVYQGRVLGDSNTIRHVVTATLNILTL